MKSFMRQIKKQGIHVSRTKIEVAEIVFPCYSTEYRELQEKQTGTGGGRNKKSQSERRQE